MPTLREVQDWVSWDGAISLRLNADGLPAGEHDLFLVVIDGVEPDGWDVETNSMPSASASIEEIATQTLTPWQTHHSSRMLRVRIHSAPKTAGDASTS